MTAFADVTDLQARWRTLTEDEQARAGTLLADASAMLAASVKLDAEDEDQAAILKIVACNMVRRSMSTGGDMYGVTQQSMTAVGFSQQLSYANPTGDMYITRAEKRMLGIGGKGQCRSIQAQTVHDETGEYGVV